MHDSPELAKCIGQNVVVDTKTDFVHLGRLAGMDESTLVLEDADVHHIVAGTTPRDEYIYQARTQGVKRNRARVLVGSAEVVSISLLDDVVES